MYDHLLPTKIEIYYGSINILGGLGMVVVNIEIIVRLQCI